MNILVTGSNGQLGNEIRIVSRYTNDNYIFTDVNEENEEAINMLHKISENDIDTSTKYLDITNLDSVRKMVIGNSIDIIVNCAAYTNVDKAEDDYDTAELLNSKSVENLSIVMKETNGLLIHISTDYVFGKEPYNTPCNEEQNGIPSGVYGLTKLHGEQNIQRINPKHIIIRTSWLYSEFGNNFVKTMLKLINGKSHINVVYDQVGTPTYAYDLAKTICAVIEDYGQTKGSYDKNGIYHFSNDGVCSWYDFAKMISRLENNDTCEIMPCNSSEFPSKVVRPSYSVLDKTKIKNTFNIKINHWIDSLEKMLENI